MIDRHTKAKILKRVQEIKKLPPPTQAHHRQAKELLRKNNEFNESRDRSLDNERKAISKDLAQYAHNQWNGIGKLFSGFGEGKIRELTCTFCGDHCSGQWHLINGKWWGSEHKQFSDLSENEIERERKSCLLTKR